ncbi:MAG: hypothetical protein AAF297_02650 [Planctomycetota bacterium]
MKTHAIILAAAASCAVAAPVTSQNDEVSFAGAFLDAVVPGSDGIGNSSFEVSTNAAEGVEIGLKAIERFIGDIPVWAGDRYQAAPGESAPGLATWNYVLVADFGSRTVSDFDVQFDVDFDAAAGSTNFVTVDVDLQAALAGSGGASTLGDSQNLGFNFWSLLGAPAFDPFANGEYDLALTVFEKGTSNVIARSDITVVVPTPGAAGVLALAGLAAVRRRR